MDLYQQWQHLLSTQRFKQVNGQIVPTITNASNEGLQVLRTDFHIDYDRVVFSRAFRRLGRKTQVHSFAKSDHTHNRLTHSIEVASVGRSLGNHVGVMLDRLNYLPKPYTPSDIGAVVQVACLSHDLGNPPFGHTGEAALREWFNHDKHALYLQDLDANEKSDICTYEGNAHSLRVVSRLEMYKNRGGMRLSCASLGSLLKYPWSSQHPNTQQKGKFNIYQSEIPLIRTVADALHLPKLGDDTWARHPLSYLMEAADDICYALLDLEDAVELGLLKLEEFEEILSNIIDFNLLSNIKNPEERCSAMRGMAIGHVINEVAERFMLHHDELLLGTFQKKDLLSVCSHDIQDMLHNAKQLAVKKIFHHESKLSTEIGAFGCLNVILDLLIPAVYAYHYKNKLNIKHKLALELMKFNSSNNPQSNSLYQDYMLVLDFICSLTDNTAAKLARELSGTGMN